MANLQFTDGTSKALQDAMQLAKDYSSSSVFPLHLLAALLENPQPDPRTGTVTPSLLSAAVEKAGGDPTALRRSVLQAVAKLPSQNPPPDDISLGPLSKLISEADTLRQNQNDSYISPHHLLPGLLSHPTVTPVLASNGVPVPALKSALVQLRKGQRFDSKESDKDGSGGEYENLNKYCTDLTQEAEEGKLDPVIGRDNEIRRMIRILCRRTKNNPVLIGEPGVGKSAVVEGLAQRIVARDVPSSLIGKVYSLDLGALKAGAKYQGEYEERVKNLLGEIEKLSSEGKNLLLFIDEIHMLMAGQGSNSGTLDIANMLKPLLARGKLRCIGATTLAEYREYIEKDAAMERRFAQVLVNEPTVPETISILRGISEKYEVHHGVRILDSSLVLAAQLAKQYLTSRRLPDSAIDLIDEASSSVKVALQTRPETIDALERSRLSLEVEIHALGREKDAASKERLEAAKKQLANIEEQLTPLVAAYEASKSAGDEINQVRKKIDELRVKVQDSERKMDLETAADLKYYAIPDLQKRLAALEQKEAEKMLSGEGDASQTVTPEDIAEVVGRWTGIPATRLMTTEKQKLLQMEKLLSKSLVGQPDAVKAVSNVVRLNRSGLGNMNRPIASFLLCGPSGTGKTLLAKTVAQFLFNSADAMVRIDASEYTEKHSVSRLIGSPPGYVGHDQGGMLTEAVRRKPYTLILVDEVEKACREFVLLFLQVLDDGRLTDGKGRVVDFRNTIIMFTSNLGAAFLNDNGEGPVTPAVRSLITGAVQAHFPPEFINRLDETIIFRTLSRGDMAKVVEIRLDEVQKRLIDNGKKIKLDVNDEAKHYLASAGYNPAYGARPLARVIQSEILFPLSRAVLDGSVREGETVIITCDPVRNALFIKPNHEAEVRNDDDTDVDMYDDDDEDDDVRIEPMD